MKSANINIPVVHLWLFSAALSVVAVCASSNALWWSLCAFALPLSFSLMGGANPGLVCLLALNWLAIADYILLGDFKGFVLGDGPFGEYESWAVVFSLCALLVLAVGIRVGQALVVRHVSKPALRSRYSALDVHEMKWSRLLGCYIIALGAIPVLLAVSRAVPAIRGEVEAFTILKYVILYLVVSKVLLEGRRYGWLVIILGLEFIIGITGFFSAYKEPIIVLILAAIGTSSRPFAGRQIFLLVSAVVFVFYASVFWTGVKGEYRAWLNDNTGLQLVNQPLGDRISKMLELASTKEIDLVDSFGRLLERITGIDYYAKTLARMDVGAVPELDLWEGALKHVTMPRLIFPEKPVLDDSAITKAVTGDTITGDTSISIGYIVESHVDFGFPGMLVPIFGIGIMLGIAAGYLITRDASLTVRTAFATAVFFNSFLYGMNIDKALGGFILIFIVAALTLKFGYPLVAPWIFDRSATHLFRIRQKT